MEKILIVEDNKDLANLMAKKISTELNFEVDIAYKLSEAKLFLKMYKYFLTLVDLNFSDLQNDEMVDYILEKNNPVIVMSANINKDFRNKMLKKNIIDYVNKSDANDINYIISTIKRVQKNKNHKVLIVDDSMVFRKQIQTMLGNMFFKVITVAHGEEALGILSTTPDISLVLTDYHMPVVNGLELTKEIRKTYSKNDLSIIVVSSDSTDETTALFLKNGANDYIKKPFSKEEFSCRINNSIEALENIHAITNHTNRDFLTGLYNRRYFLENAKSYFETAIYNSESFAIAALDIDNFKYINDTYGHESGDKVINSLADILRANTNQDDIVARFNSEEFYILIKNITTDNALGVFERLRKKVQNSVTLSNKEEEIKFTISIGICINPEDTFDESLNQADMMLYNAKQNGKNQVFSN